MPALQRVKFPQSASPASSAAARRLSKAGTAMSEPVNMVRREIIALSSGDSIGEVLAFARRRYCGERDDAKGAACLLGGFSIPIFDESFLFVWFDVFRMHATVTRQQTNELVKVGRRPTMGASHERSQLTKTHLTLSRHLLPVAPLQHAPCKITNQIRIKPAYMRFLFVTYKLQYKLPMWKMREPECAGAHH
jgi:hypothetical protein